MFEDAEKDFILPNTLGAMAKTFYVKTAKNLKQDNWFLKQGSTVTGVKVIAQGEQIHEVQRLINKYLLPNVRFAARRIVPSTRSGVEGAGATDSASAIRTRTRSFARIVRRRC